MSRPRKAAIVSIVLLGAALLAAPSPAAAQGPSGRDPVRIGVAGPISGGSAAFGLQFEEGVEQAVADINAGGGILGRELTLVIGDDRGLWNVFRTCGRDDQQGEVAGAYILQQFKGQNVAIVHDKTTYGQGLADETRATINRGGMKEVLYEGVNRGDKDFSALVSKIKASGAALLYWGGLHDTGAMIVRQMRDQGVRVRMMGGDGLSDDEFAAIAGPGAEGTLMTYSADPRRRPQAQAVLNRFRARNVHPQVYTLYSYAAVEILKQAAEAAKSLDPRKMAEQMKSGMTFKTAIGDLSYDRKGDITRVDYVVYVWKKDAGGKLTYAEMP